MLLSLRLKRSGGGALVGAALAVTLAALMLAVFPAVAEAQTEAQTEGKSTPSVVVRPGDSLWSISEERLGPNATPQRIARGTEQIYALNRGLIGADPDLILVGQQLLVPPAMSVRPIGATPAPKKTASAVEAAGANPRDRATKRATRNTADNKAPGTAPGGAGVKGGEASEPVAQRASLPGLPDGAAAAPAPAVRAVTSNGAQPSPVASLLRTIRTEVASAASALAESFRAGIGGEAPEKGRRLLGVGVLVLTLVVAALVAWKLPMRRTTRRDAERWGAPSGYYGYYGQTPAASPPVPSVYHPGPLGGSLGGSLGDRDERDTRQEARREAPRALGHERRAALTGSEDSSAPGIVGKAGSGGRTAKATRAKARAVPRNGLALGAHNPKVRRAPRRAHATMRARELRPRLRPRRVAPRRPKLPVALGKKKGVNTCDGGR